MNSNYKVLLNQIELKLMWKIINNSYHLKWINRRQAKAYHINQKFTLNLNIIQTQFSYF